MVAVAPLSIRCVARLTTHVLLGRRLPLARRPLRSEERLLRGVMALNDLVNQYKPDNERLKKLPLPGARRSQPAAPGRTTLALTVCRRRRARAAYVFLESRSPEDRKPRYRCQCTWCAVEPFAPCCHASRQRASQ